MWVTLSLFIGPSVLAADTDTSSVGTAIGVSISVTFVVSFTLGALVASVLCYISIRSKGSSYKPSSPSDPTTVYDDLRADKKLSGDIIQMDMSTAYGSHHS